MHYRLTCPCGVSHAVSTSQAGQELHCACGNTLSVPTLRGLKELPPAEPAGAEALSMRAHDQARRPSILLGTLFVIIFLAIPAVIFFAYQRLSLDTSNTRQAEQQLAFKQLDAAGPEQLSEAWEAYSTTPLGPPVKPDFYKVEREARTWNWCIGITCGIALLAAITAAAIIVQNRQARDRRLTAQTQSGS